MPKASQSSRVPDAHWGMRWCDREMQRRTAAEGHPPSPATRHNRLCAAVCTVVFFSFLCNNAQHDRSQFGHCNGGDSALRPRRWGIAPVLGGRGGGWGYKGTEAVVLVVCPRGPACARTVMGYGVAPTAVQLHGVPPRPPPAPRR